MSDDIYVTRAGLEGMKADLTEMLHTLRCICDLRQPSQNRGCRSLRRSASDNANRRRIEFDQVVARQQDGFLLVGIEPVEDLDHNSFCRR